MKHVDSHLADYLEGRLAPRETRAVEEHLQSCAQCAADLAFARRLQDSAREQGLAHLSPPRIVALADRVVTATPVEEHHLRGCVRCREELSWAQRQHDSHAPDSVHAPEDSGRGVQDSPPGKGMSLRNWGLMAAAAAVLVVSLLMFFRDSEDPGAWAELAQVEPIPVNITRNFDTSGEYDEARLLGLAAYRDGDYQAAVEQLSLAAELKPHEPEVRLYLGSAAMLTEDQETAAMALAACRELAKDGPLRAEASWQLANSHLLGGREAESRKLLLEIQSAGGHRAEDANRLLESLTR